MKTFLLIIACFLNFHCRAQLLKTDTLYQLLDKYDEQFFDAAFNLRNGEELRKYLSEDLEFFHDKGGLIAKSADKLISSFEGNWKKMESGHKRFQRRESINDSKEIYRLGNFGGMVMGEHKFYEYEQGGEEIFDSKGKYITVWKNENGKWTANRIISYNHLFPGFEKIIVSDRLECEIENWLQSNHIPLLSIAIINDGEIDYVNTFNSQDHENTYGTKIIYKVASITKPLTALVILKLVDEGKWNLDEPLSKYWIDPDLVNDPRVMNLTTRHVLSHKSGLPNWRHLKEGKILKFESDPGEKFGYSGEGFEFLRRSIEAKFNLSFEAITDSILFEPLGMNDTRFWWDNQMDTLAYSQNYDLNGDQYPTEKYYKAMSAGNLLTTIEDYAKFASYIIQGANLSNEIYNDMTKLQTSIWKNDLGVGLGWMIMNINGEEMLYHDGRDPGVRTIVNIFPRTNKAVIIFSNGDNGDLVYNELLKKLSPQTRNAVEVLSSVKEKYSKELREKNH